jgi:hypothetical protein
LEGGERGSERRGRGEREEGRGEGGREVECESNRREERGGEEDGEMERREKREKRGHTSVPRQHHFLPNPLGTGRHVDGGFEPVGGPTGPEAVAHLGGTILSLECIWR